MKNINWDKKYKRLFTFGCSFTRYMWPTYACLLNKHFLPKQFANAGRPGGGSLICVSRLTQANRYFKFDENDLIVIMYPSYTREDRFKETTWECAGNIFTARKFDKDFLKKYGNMSHYVLRDFALIDTIQGYLKNLKCDNIQLMSVPHTGLEEYTYYPQDELEVLTRMQDRYNDLFTNFAKDYTTFLMDTNNTGIHNGWGHEYDGLIDPHPKPTIALEYLKYLGLNPNQEVIDFAYESDINLSKLKTRQEILDFYHDYNEELDWCIKHYILI